MIITPRAPSHNLSSTTLAALDHPNIDDEVKAWATDPRNNDDQVRAWLREHYPEALGAAGGIRVVMSRMTKPDDKHPTAQEWGYWPAVREVFTHRVWADKKGALFNFAHFDGGRQAKHVTQLDAVVLDFDGGATIEDVEQQLDGLEFALATTFNHTAERHKFRVLLPLAEPCPASDWPSVWAGAVALVGGKVDVNCKNKDRWYYVASHPPGAEGLARFIVGAGAVLTWQELAALAPDSVKPLSLSGAVDDVFSKSLAALPDAERKDLARESANTPQMPAVGRQWAVEELMDMARHLTLAACREVTGDPTLEERPAWFKFGLMPLKAEALRRPDKAQALREVFDVASETLGGSTANNDHQWNTANPQNIDLGSFVLAAKAGGWKPAPALPAVAAGGAVAAAICEGPAGDTTNGRFFAENLRGQLLYCHATGKWFRWGAGLWRECSKGEHMQAAKMVADHMVGLAADAWRRAPEDPKAKALMKAAQNLHGSEPRLIAMLSMASSEPGMSIASPAEMDRDPMKLGTRNGVLDLETGELLTPTPEMLISRSVRAAYNPAAKCPRWLSLLDDAFGGDAEMIAYIRRALGYTLTGKVSEEVMFFAHGQGHNGKSVMANVLERLMGGYSLTASAELLAVPKNGGGNAARGDIAQLSGARLVLANETRAGEMWDDATLKRIVSTERISARYNFGENFSFQPTHKIWVRGNNKPGLRDTTNGTWRRIQLIGFDHAVPEERRIKDLEHLILAEEAEGVLAWLVQGCMEWQRQGLATPAKIRNATRQYREDCDEIGEWLEEHAELNPDAKVTTADAYQNYSTWAKAAGLRGMARKTFSRALCSRPMFRPVKIGALNGIAGLKLTGYGGILTA